MRKSSFAELWEIVSAADTAEDMQPLQQDIAHSGLTTMYAKQRPEFWQNLVQLANNDAKGLGEMLNVSPEIVATWKRKIEQIATASNQNSNENPIGSTIKTGE